MREFRREVLDRSSEARPIDTFFTDSSDLIAPFMNSTSGRDGLTFGQNVNFLGRSGLQLIKGLRVAFISGVDCDLLGPEVKAANPDENYIGNYFVMQDVNRVIEQYKAMVAETGREGVDILLSG